MIEVELPDGTIAEFPEGTSNEAMQKALQSYMKPTAQPASGKSPDGTVSAIPDGMVYNPQTGQYTSRELQAPHDERRANRSLLQKVGDQVLGDADPTTQNMGEKIGSFLNKGGESASFGLVGDEADAVFRSAVTGQNYSDELRGVREQEQMFERENPGAALTADVGGAVAGAMLPLGAIGTMKNGTGLGAKLALGAIGTMKNGTGLGAKLAASSAAGAGMGGLYGFMEGEGGDRLDGAKDGALFGALAGAAAPVVARGLQFAGRRVVDPIRGALGFGNANRAQQAIVDAVKSSGRSVDDISNDLATAARDGQPEYVLADALGNPGQRALSGVARRPGPQRTDIVEALNRRQSGQGERIASFVEDSFGFRPSAPGTQVAIPGGAISRTPQTVLSGAQRSAKQTAEALTGARKEIADVSFDAARSNAGPVDVRDAVSILDGKIKPFEDAGLDDAAIGELRKLRGQLASEGAEASFELSDFNKVFQIRRRLKDKINQLFKAGESEVARDLKPVLRALDDAMEDSSEGYRKAMSEYRTNSGIIDAVDEGVGMARPGARATDNVQRFGAMTPDEQAAARVGYGDRLLQRVENAAEGANKARPLTSAKSAQERAGLALDPQRLSQRLSREQTMFETARQATGGSQTADNLADSAASQAFDASAIVNLLSGRFGAAGQQIATSTAQAMSGQNEATRHLIARALLSRDPQAALSQALKYQGITDAQRRIIETLTRRIGVAAPQ